MLKDAPPGQGQALELDGAGRAPRFDAGRLEHEAHGVRRHLIYRQGGDGLAPQPCERLANTLAVGRHRLEPAHQDVEQALAWVLIRKFPSVVRQDGAVDAA